MQASESFLGYVVEVQFVAEERQHFGGHTLPNRGFVKRDRWWYAVIATVRDETTLNEEKLRAGQTWACGSILRKELGSAHGYHDPRRVAIIKEGGECTKKRERNVSRQAGTKVADSLGQRAGGFFRWFVGSKADNSIEDRKGRRGFFWMVVVSECQSVLRYPPDETSCDTGQTGATAHVREPQRGSQSQGALSQSAQGST